MHPGMPVPFRTCLRNILWKRRDHAVEKFIRHDFLAERSEKFLGCDHNRSDHENIAVALSLDRTRDQDIRSDLGADGGMRYIRAKRVRDMQLGEVGVKRF